MNNEAGSVPESGPKGVSPASCMAWLDHIHDVLVVLDPSARVLYASSGVQARLGYSFDALVGRDVRAYIHGDDLAQVEAALAEAMSHPGQAVSVVCRVRHTLGGYRIAECRGTFYAGLPEGPAVVFMARDVTLQTYRDRLLSAWVEPLLGEMPSSEKLLEQACGILVRTLNLSLVIAVRPQLAGFLRIQAHADDGHWRDLLQALLDLEDFRDTGDGLNCLTHLVQEGQVRALDAGLDSDCPGLAEMAKQGVARVGILPYVTTEGAQAGLLLLSADPLAMDADTVDLLTLFRAQLVVAMRMAEEHAHKEMLCSALALVASAVFITDREGVIEWVNEAFARQTGFSPAEAIGHTPRLLRSGIHDPKYYEILKETIRAGRSWHGETTNRRRDGSLYTVEQTITPILEGRREVRHFVSIQQDITEHKRMERDIRGLALAIEHARHAERCQIAREVHDELGGSLAALRHDLEWLLKRVDDDVSQERLRTMLELATQTLAAARKITIGLKPNLVEELGFDGALGWLARDFGRRNDVLVRLDLAPALSKLRRDQAMEVFRVVQECLTNVAKHAQATEVLVRGWVAEGHLHVEVTDNGVGYDPEGETDMEAMGTHGMAERARMLGGYLEIDRRESAGMRVCLVAPLGLEKE